jgi:hypothetical protein
VCQTKSIEISAFGNGINITGRSHIYVRLNTHPCKQQKMQAWEKLLRKAVLVQITETELVKHLYTVIVQ